MATELDGINWDKHKREVDQTQRVKEAVWAHTQKDK